MRNSRSAFALWNYHHAEQKRDRFRDFVEEVAFDGMQNTFDEDHTFDANSTSTGRSMRHESRSSTSSEQGMRRDQRAGADMPEWLLPHYLHQRASWLGPCRGVDRGVASSPVVW